MNVTPTITTRPDGNMHIHIPMLIKSKEGRRMVIAPKGLDGDNLDATSTVQDAIVMAIVRANSWCELIESGEVKSISELSRLLQMDGSFLTRTMKLSTLAPDIVEQIFLGNEPNGLSLTALLKPFPDDWEEQRLHFGFE